MNAVQYIKVAPDSPKEACKSSYMAHCIGTGMTGKAFLQGAHIQRALHSDRHPALHLWKTLTNEVTERTSQQAGQRAVWDSVQYTEACFDTLSHAAVQCTAH